MVDNGRGVARGEGDRDRAGHGIRMGMGGKRCDACVFDGLLDIRGEVLPP